MGSDTESTCTGTQTCDFNPRSPCGERHIDAGFGILLQTISIHAPRVGSDELHRALGHVGNDFNPRSPCGERPTYTAVLRLWEQFQSTLPVWGATLTVSLLSPPKSHFNPRSPCGERLPGSASCFPLVEYFNPRSPCGERLDYGSGYLISKPFQSTLPVWGATGVNFNARITSLFQSTLPVWGATPYGGRRSGGADDFNPRSPCGERPTLRVEDCQKFIFQSTLPVWGATAKMHRFFFCIFGKKGIFCDILQIGRHLQGIGRKRWGDFLSRSVRTSRGKYGCLAFAFRESGGLRENRRFYSQSVLFSFRIDCQGSRIAGCPFRGP